MILFGICAVIGMVMIWNGLYNHEWWWVPFGILTFICSLFNIALMLGTIPK